MLVKPAAYEIKSIEEPIEASEETGVEVRAGRGIKEPKIYCPVYDWQTSTCLWRKKLKFEYAGK